MQRPLFVVGVVLVVIGVVALVYQGIHYTTRETVVDVPGVRIEAKTDKTLPLPPILGGLALAGGIVLLVVASRGRG